MGEPRFLHALSYCMLLPGPEAQQLATYIGWLMHRWPGAVTAGGLFVVPGVIAIMALSWIYAAFGNVPTVAALFFGLKAAVLAIVLQAVHRVGSRALKTGAMIALAARLCCDFFQPCALSAHRARRRRHRLCGCSFWFVRFCGRGGTQLRDGSDHREPPWRGTARTCPADNRARFARFSGLARAVA